MISDARSAIFPATISACCLTVTIGVAVSVRIARVGLVKCDSSAFVGIGLRRIDWLRAASIARSTLVDQLDGVREVGSCPVGVEFAVEAPFVCVDDFLVVCRYCHL